MEEWREGTSRNVTFSYNLASEGLADASHPKGEHSKAAGADTSPTFSIATCGHTHDAARSSRAACAAHHQQSHYTRAAARCSTTYALANGAIARIERADERGAATCCARDRRPWNDCPSSRLAQWRSRVLEKDNIAVDRNGAPLPMFGRYGETRAKLIKADKPLSWPAGIAVLPAREVETHVLANAGARPWDRDEDDNRVLYFIAEGQGKIIDDEKEVSAYPAHKETRAPFVEATGTWRRGAK